MQRGWGFLRGSFDGCGGGGKRKAMAEWYIAFWNQRFTVAAVEAIDAPRPLPSGVDVNVLFAETEARVLREDFTFRYRNVHWQVEGEGREKLRPKQKVTIERRLDGSVHYRCGERYLTPVRFVAPPRPPKKSAPPPPPRRHRPPADHPWRKLMPIEIRREA